MTSAFVTPRRIIAALVFASGAAFLAPSLAGAATAPTAPQIVTLLDDANATPAPSPSPKPTDGRIEGANTPTADDPPHGSGRGTKKGDKKFEHLELTPTLMETISTGSDVHQPGGPPNLLPYDLLRIIGEFRYRFTPHLGVMYQRIAHTGAAGRTYKAGKPSYGGSGYDYEERELATWTFNPLLVYRAGYHYRARVCCAGSGDPTAIPRFLGGFFTDITWKTWKPGLGGRPLSLNFRWEQNDHRFTAAAQKNLARGDYDSGQKPTFATAAYANFYIYHQTGIVPYYGLEYYSTYFSNNPHMSETFRKVYGVTVNQTGDLFLKIYVKNDQPTGNAGGDASHKSTLFIEQSFRIHH